MIRHGAAACISASICVLTDADVPAPAHTPTLTSDTPDLHVMVLVRREGGEYLPVTLSVLSDSQTSTDGTDTRTVSVQVRPACKKLHICEARFSHAVIALHIAMKRLVCVCVCCVAQAQVDVCCKQATGLVVEMWAKVNGRHVHCTPRKLYCILASVPVALSGTHPVIHFICCCT